LRQVRNTVRANGDTHSQIFITLPDAQRIYRIEILQLKAFCKRFQRRAAEAEEQLCISIYYMEGSDGIMLKNIIKNANIGNIPPCLALCMMRL